MYSRREEVNGGGGAGGKRIEGEKENEMGSKDGWMGG